MLSICCTKGWTNSSNWKLRAKHPVTFPADRNKDNKHNVIKVSAAPPFQGMPDPYLLVLCLHFMAHVLFCTYVSLQKHYVSDHFSGCRFVPFNSLEKLLVAAFVCFLKLSFTTFQCTCMLR